jgi:hypothetical protein
MPVDDGLQNKLPPERAGVKKRRQKMRSHLQFTALRKF